MAIAASFKAVGIFGQALGCLSLLDLEVITGAVGFSGIPFVGFVAGIPPPQPPFPVALTDPLGHPPAVLPPPPALSPIGVGIEAIGFRFLVCPTNSVNEP